jgi:hypothetical protein
VIIEAARGLGDAVVGGKVAADRYVVDSRGVLAETTPVVPEAPVLSEADILSWRKRCATWLPAPAARATSSGRLTGLCHPPVPAHHFAGRPACLLQSLTADMAPGLVKPMVYSTNTYAKAREVFGKLFTELIGPNDYDFTRLVPLICSRVYADMTLMGELLTRIGCPPTLWR